MKKFNYLWLYMLLVMGAVSNNAHAGLVLDTVGTSVNNSMLTLDSNDFVAAEFSLVDGQVITDLKAYINAGNSGVAGDGFTFHLYSADGKAGLPGTDLYSVDSTYQADGWNGVSNLNVSGLTAGNYWLALEVSGSSNLELPGFSTSGSAPALAYAFNAGSGYSIMTGANFGVQVSSVPLPAAFWLFGSSLCSFLFSMRRKSSSL